MPANVVLKRLVPTGSRRLLALLLLLPLSVLAWPAEATASSASAAPSIASGTHATKQNANDQQQSAPLNATPLPDQADQESASDASPMPRYGASESSIGASEVLRMLLSLVAVLAAIILLALLLRRMPVLQSQLGALAAKDSAISIISTRSISPREKLLVIEVDERRMLIATGANGTSLLSELKSAPDAASAGYAQDPSAKASSHLESV